MNALSTVTNLDFFYPKFFSACALQKKIVFIALSIFSLLAVCGFRLYCGIRAKKIGVSVDRQQQSGMAQKNSSASSTIVELSKQESSAIQKNPEQENSQMGQQDNVGQQSWQIFVKGDKNILIKILSLYLDNLSAYRFSLTCKYFDEIFQEPLNIGSRLNELCRIGRGYGFITSKKWLSLVERAGLHLKVLDVHSQKVSHSDFVKIAKNFKNIKEVNFLENAFLTNEILSCFSNNLEYLSIIKCNLVTNKALIELFQRSSCLRGINLTMDAWSFSQRLDDEIFVNLPNDLKILSISGWRPEVTSRELEMFFKRQNKLEELSLEGLEELNHSCLANFSETLEKLTLWDCSEITDSLVGLLKRLNNLKVLKLKNSIKEFLKGEVFENLSEKIVELGINGYIFFNEDLGKKFVRLKDLKRVDLSNSATIKESSLLKLSQGLEDLNIVNCPLITDQGYISIFKRLVNLQSVSLQLYEPDVLLHLPRSVKILDLHCIKITDEICIELFKLLTEIRQIKFRYSENLTDAILYYLPDSLTKIEFMHCPNISKDACQNLSKRINVQLYP